jgi:hypothetical protein
MFRQGINTGWIIITGTMKTTLKTKHHRVLAYIEIDSRGVHRILDHGHRTLGYYDPRTNRTTDRHHRLIGYGYLLPRLIPADLAEEGGAGTIQPEKPLTPAQSRRESERRAKVQDRIQATRTTYQKKLQDLRADL